MAESRMDGPRARIGVGFRIIGGVLAVAFFWAAWGFASIWYHVPNTGNGWLELALGTLVMGGLFSYVAVTGRSPMPQDRMKRE